MQRRNKRKQMWPLLKGTIVLSTGDVNLVVIKLNICTQYHTNQCPEKKHCFTYLATVGYGNHVYNMLEYLF